MLITLKKIQMTLLILPLVLATHAFSNEAESLPSKGQLSPEASGTANLVLTIDGIRKHTGTLRIGIYNSETGHSSQQEIGGVNADVNTEAVIVEFDGMAEGQYAINLYHDVNGDGEMNTNLFGIPSEPFAFSNNAKGNFGPAKWQDAAFEVKAGVNSHTITMFK